MDEIYQNKTREQIIELIYDMTLQNTNGRESGLDMFRKGVESCYDELFEEESSESRKKNRITLCGSTKFKREFQAVNKHLSLEGYVVYSVALFGHADNESLTTDQKVSLDIVHKKKIDNSDSIFVIDVDKYIGESTRNEIEYAKANGKQVKYLSDYPDLVFKCDQLFIN